jgi:peptidoglycan-associated lipoprotein
MKTLVLVLAATVVAVCSMAGPAVMPAAAADLSGIDLSGRWTGKWTGTGLLNAFREDAATLHLVQNDKGAYGRFVLEGTGAAESVPIAVRYAGLWGIRVQVKIKGDRVTLRHERGGHLFTADLRVSPDGEQMYGLVRGGHPRIMLMLARAREDAPNPQTAMGTPAPLVQVQPPLRTESPKGEALGKIEPAPKLAAAAPEQKEPEAPPREEQFVGVAELAPIHFDFDKADLRKDAIDTLTAHITWLKDHADALLLIEGHCDERGTDEYNLALGERRAKSVSDLLAAHGISADRISTTSYGREQPVCTASTEDCRTQNRRAEFRIKTR